MEVAEKHVIMQGSKQCCEATSAAIKGGCYATIVLKGCAATSEAEAAKKGSCQVSE